MKRILLITLLAALLAACAPVQPASEAPAQTAATTSGGATVENNLSEGCVEGYNAETDYFPQKTTLTQTQGFSVEYHNNYKVVTIKTPWPGAT